MLAICWDLGLSPKWLGKHTLFKPPFGWVMRALGGLPVDRGNPAGLVDEIVVRARTGRPLMLVIAPEAVDALTALMVRSMRFNVMVQDGEMQWMTDDRVVSVIPAIRQTGLARAA